MTEKPRARRPLLAATLCAALVVALAGCAAAPLTARDVSLTSGTKANANPILDDKFTVSGSAKLLKGRTDATKVQLQRLANGKWVTFASKKLGKGTTVVSASITAKETKYSFRTSVVTIDTPRKVVASSSAQVVAPFDLKNGLRTLLYDMTQAYQQNSTAGVNFDLANSYPGFIDATSATYKANAALIVSGQYTDSEVPELSTIAPAPEWVPSSTSCYTTTGEPPSGRTFIVTIDDTQTEDGYLSTTQKFDGHITLLNGKLYYFPNTCG
jgi:hypothetical protein